MTTTRIEPKFNDNAMKVLCKRYLRPLPEPHTADRGPDYQILYDSHRCKLCGKSHETPSEMLWRCSFDNNEYYNLLASLDFLPNSPTLFNAGTGSGTFSGCFKFDVDDSMASIMKVATKGAEVQREGGGVGYTLSAVRPEGAPVRSTHGKACGPIAVMGVYHAVDEMITQGGKRNGAQMAVLHCEHQDIQKFIHCKDVPKLCLCRTCELVDDCRRSYTKVFDTFNISVAATDEFMRNATILGTESNKLFEGIVQSAWETADPGLFFIDTAERGNLTPWLGKLTGTNPCGEVPLMDNEACNLGSINLSHMVVNNAFDFYKLGALTHLATRYLDEVLDNNHFPDPDIDKIARKTRKLGLGVMGWADTLAMLKIPYDSDAALSLAETVMFRIQHDSHEESEKLAKQKGLCPAFMIDSDKDTYEVSEKAMRPGVPKRRNAVTTCIAPTGTIAILAGCSSGIEPYSTLDGVRAMGDGTVLEERKRVDSGTFVPKVAHEIDYQWHVKHQATFQKYTDLAVSKTINMPESATVDDIRKAYIMAWELGCKGITVYRDNSKFKQIIVNKGQESKLHTGYGSLTAPKGNGHEVYPTDTIAGAHRRRLPKTGPAIRHAWTVGESEGYLNVGLFPEDKTPGEIFITESNSGSTVSGLLDAISIITSLALQYGVPLETLVNKLQHIQFEPKGMTGNKDIPIASSVVAYIFRFMGQQYLGKGDAHQATATLVFTGMTCPECGALTATEEGCLVCSARCGWTKCGG